MKKYVAIVAGGLILSILTPGAVVQAGRTTYNTACYGGTTIGFQDAPADTYVVSVTSGRRNKGTQYVYGIYTGPGVTFTMGNGGDCLFTSPLYANWMSSTGRILSTRQING